MDIVSVLFTCIWIFPVDVDLERRKGVVSTATNVIVEFLVQFIAFDITYLWIWIVMALPIMNDNARSDTVQVVVFDCASANT